MNKRSKAAEGAFLQGNRGSSWRILGLAAAAMAAVLLAGTISFAATAPAVYYVRSGSAGGNGTDWTQAFSSLPATLVRGATYYIADGSYGSYTFDDPGTGTITITRCAPADPICTSANGYSAGDNTGQTVFGRLTFSAGYYTLDGITGGGPNSWNSGYGIVVSTSDADQVVIGNVSTVTLRHIDVVGISRTSQVGQWGIYAVNGGSNMTLSYCRFYNQQKVNIAFYGVSNVLIEYCKIGPNGQAGVTYADGTAMHKIGLSLRNNATLTVRYNLFEDISETSYIGVVNDAAGEVASNWSIYGNVFFETRTLPGTGNSYLIGLARSNTTLSNFKFVNNTIANMSQMSNVGIYNIMINGGGNIAQNNLWYNNIANSLYLQGVTGSYNYYDTDYRTEGYTAPYPSINPTNELGGQIASGNPFVDMATRNFHLTAATNPGISLTAPFTTDPDGSVRGADGVWDRGAFEFDSGGGKSIPSPPGNLSIQ